MVPRQCHNRKTPLSIVTDIKEKLDSYTDEGILTPVNYSTGWISNSASVCKSDRTLSVCFDPFNLNKVIQHNHVPSRLPTLNDVLSKLEGARVFSFYEIKDGFLQLSLSNFSSDLTLLWILFCKYKWLEMLWAIFKSKRLPKKCDPLP